MITFALILGVLAFGGLAFAFAGVLAGVSGALVTLDLGVISPAMFGVDPSIEMVIWVAVGGRGSRGERPPSRAFAREQGLDALQSFASKVGRAVRGSKARDPAVIEAAQAVVALANK